MDLHLFISFVLLLAIIYGFYSQQDNAITRALVVSGSLVLSFVAYTHYGLTAAVFCGVAMLVIIMKAMGFSFATSLFFLVAITTLEKIILIGLDKFLK